MMMSELLDAYDDDHSLFPRVREALRKTGAVIHKRAAHAANEDCIEKIAWPIAEIGDRELARCFGFKLARETPVPENIVF